MAAMGCAACSGQSGQNAEIELSDFYCGPVGASDGYGVVITSYEESQKRTYFLQGRATVVCPDITSRPSIVGTEVDRCLKLNPNSDEKCRQVKVLDLLPES